MLALWDQGTARLVVILVAFMQGEMCRGLTGFPDETGAVCTAHNMAPLVLLLLWRVGEVVDVTHVCKSPYWLVGRQESGKKSGYHISEMLYVPRSRSACFY